MAGRDGNGTFTYSHPDFIGGTVISSSEMDQNNTDAATALTQSIAVDGQSTITGNIPLFGFKVTGLGAGASATDSATLGQIQANAYAFQGTDTGAADAYVIALFPAVTVQGAGLRVSFVAANASTGPSTLNAGGGADAIEYQGAALTGAEIAAGATIVCDHDGTAFQMVSPSALLGTGVVGPGSSIDNAIARYDGTTGELLQDSSASVGDDGSIVPGAFVGSLKGSDIASANPLVIGTDGDMSDVTGTTGFATMTVGANRQFQLQFDGILIVTNGASMILPGGANITTAAGDVWSCRSIAADTVLVTGITKADGTPVVPGLSPGLVLLETATPSGAASVVFSTSIDSTYQAYKFIGNDLVVSTDNVALHMKCSVDGGSSYLATHFYRQTSQREDGVGSAAGAASANQIVMFSSAAEGMGTTAGNAGAFELMLTNPANTANYKSCHWQGTHWRQAHMVEDFGSGGVATITAINAVEFVPSAGNITGTIRMYGVVI